MKSIKPVINLIILLIIIVRPSAAISDTHNDIVNAIVNIEFNKVVPWDDGYNTSGFGTGFVIDAEQGIILTNKHIVNVSPIVAFAEFSNNRKLPVTPIYRDPVHDFGMFKYDPSLINDLEIKPIALNTSASIGDPITLYGNDGGEALSIIEGVLSRLDRPAPNYNSTNNDYNTFYMQAALGTSGGSSGSPILNNNGEAIAINAGGRFDTATAFFLPMDMMYSVIKKVLSGDRVTRGTLEIVFEHVPFNQMAKFGKDIDQIEFLKQRVTNAKGRLMINHIVKESSADKHFLLGDFLVAVNDQQIHNFLQLETILNNTVGETVSATIERNGQLISANILVSDLFDLVPDEYIEFGKTVFTPIGLSLARLFNVPSNGVLITSDGRVFGGKGIRNFARVDTINDTEVNDLEALKSKLESISLNEKVTVRYRYVYNQQNQEFVKFRNLSQFFVNRHCVSMLGKKRWDCKQLNISDKFAVTKKSVVENKVSSPFVDIEVFRPIEVNIEGNVHLKGLGLVIDKEAGLILTDQGNIDSTLSQVNLYFNNGTTTSADVLAIHPYLNLVLLKTDITDIKFAEDIIPKLTGTQLNDFKDSRLVGRSTHLDFETDVSIGWPLLVFGETNFDSYDVTFIPREFSLYLSEHNDLLGIAPGSSEKSSIDAVIPAELILDFVNAVKLGKGGLFELKDQLGYVSFAEAIELGLKEPFLNQIQRKIFVQKAAELEDSGLKSGDIILQLDGKNLTRLNDLYLSLNNPSHQLKILRNGKIINIDLIPKQSQFINIAEILIWAGSVIHEMPIIINTPMGRQDSCLRIGFRYFGAPMFSALGSNPACILSVDNIPIQTVKDLKELLFAKSVGEFTKVSAVRLDKNFQLAEYQIREDNYYWPTIYYAREGNQWSFLSNLESTAED